MKTIKTLFLLAFGMMASLASMACPVCDKNQPEALQGISHGAGPDSQWDTWIVAVAAIIVVVTLALSIKYLFKPGESDPQHIKKLILND